MKNWRSTERFLVVSRCSPEPTDDLISLWPPRKINPWAPNRSFSEFFSENFFLTWKDKYRQRGGLKSLRYAKLLTSGSRGQEARRAFYRRPREKLLLSLRKNTRHFHILGSFLEFILTIKIIMKFEENYPFESTLGASWQTRSIHWVGSRRTSWPKKC